MAIKEKPSDNERERRSKALINKQAQLDILERNIPRIPPTGSKIKEISWSEFYRIFGFKPSLLERIFLTMEEFKKWQ